MRLMPALSQREGLRETIISKTFMALKNGNAGVLTGRARSNFLEAVLAIIVQPALLIQLEFTMKSFCQATCIFSTP